MRSSTWPEMIPNISSPVEPSSKITVPAGSSRVSLAPLKTPRTFTLMARSLSLGGLVLAGRLARIVTPHAAPAAAV